MLPLEMLSDSARSAFFEAFLESLRMAARSTISRLDARQRSQVESLVSIEDVSLEVSHEDLAYDMVSYTCDYTVQGLDASGERVYLSLQVTQ